MISKPRQKARRHRRKELIVRIDRTFVTGRIMRCIACSVLFLAAAVFALLTVPVFSPLFVLLVALNLISVAENHKRIGRVVLRFSTAGLEIFARDAHQSDFIPWDEIVFAELVQRKRHRRIELQLTAGSMRTIDEEPCNRSLVEIAEEIHKRLN